LSCSGLEKQIQKLNKSDYGNGAEKFLGQKKRSMAAAMLLFDCIVLVLRLRW
jgi:hypothetical protein